MKSRSGLLVRACLQALQPRSMVPAMAAATAALLAAGDVGGGPIRQEIEFDIPSQSLEAALLEFSRQADVQVMVGSTALAGLTSPQVKGRLAVVRALDALLQKSGSRLRDP